MNGWMHIDVVEAVYRLLILHQRKSSHGGCACGAVDLGESYSRHVAEVLGSAGLLLRWPPSKGGDA